MANEELKKSGITAKTPENILLGAGTIHKGLKLDPETKKWNFAESLIGATSGGSTCNITPEITDIEVDGKLVRVKGLEVKTGEVATVETNLIELTPDIISSLIIGTVQDSEDYEGFEEIVSRSQLNDGDYLENFSYVGHKIDGTPIIIIFPNARVSGGFSVNGKNKAAGVVTATFECVADLEGDYDKLPYRILYPKATTV